MSVGSMGIRGRILSGFGIVLALLVAIAAFGGRGFSVIIAASDDFARIGEATVRIQDIERTVVGILRNAMTVPLKDDSKALDRLRDLRASLDALLGRAIADERDPGRRAGLTELSGAFTPYAADLDRAILLKGRRDDLRDRELARDGAAMHEALGRMAQGAEAQGNWEGATRLRAMDETVLATRLEVLRYMLTPSAAVLEGRQGGVRGDGQGASGAAPAGSRPGAAPGPGGDRGHFRALSPGVRNRHRFDRPIVPTA